MTLLNEIKDKIDGYKVVSFDIFDTLLLRPYVKPTDLFLHLERLENAVGFAKARIEAEQKARKVHANLEDITIDEIYDEIADKYKNLKSKELDLECQILQPNPEMKDVFDYAKKSKKRIIIVSDMYLPAKFLSNVLRKKGFYWFTWEGTQKDIDRYETQTYQKSHKQEFLDWNIMELFMTAPTPPVERIDNGKVIFKQITPNEAVRIKIYPDLSQGAVNFAQKYVDVFGKYGIDFVCERLIDWVNILCNTPTQIDKEHFVNLYHAWNQEHTEWQPLPLQWFYSSKEDFEPLKEIKRFYLLGVPLFKIKKTVYRWKLSVFHFLPLISYKHKIDRKCLYLLGIPLFQIKQKTNSISVKTTYSLFKILPLISVKRK